MAKRKHKTPKTPRQRPAKRPSMVVTTHTVRTTRLAHYALGDFTDDSLESGQMAVIRAAHQKDCGAAEGAMSKLRDMGKFVKSNEPKRQKQVDRIIGASESYVSKACKR